MLNGGEKVLCELPERLVLPLVYQQVQSAEARPTSTSQSAPTSEAEI